MECELEASGGLPTSTVKGGCQQYESLLLSTLRRVVAFMPVSLRAFKVLASYRPALEERLRILVTVDQEHAPGSFAVSFVSVAEKFSVAMCSAGDDCRAIRNSDRSLQGSGCTAGRQHCTEGY